MPSSQRPASQLHTVRESPQETIDQFETLQTHGADGSMDNLASSTSAGFNYQPSVPNNGLEVEVEVEVEGELEETIDHYSSAPVRNKGKGRAEYTSRASDSGMSNADLSAAFRTAARRKASTLILVPRQPLVLEEEGESD